MLDIPRVQVQIKSKIGLLSKELKKYPDITDELVDYLMKLRFSNLTCMENEIDFLVKRFRELAYPIYRPEISPPNPKYGDVIDHEWALRALSNCCVIGVDTSEIAPTPHIAPLFLLVNVGFQAIIYGEKPNHINGSRPNFYIYSELAEEFEGVRRLPSWVLEVKRIENELAVISNVADLIKGVEHKIVLFDESFSLSYLMTRDRKFRVRVARAMWDLLCRLRDLNVIPVGVFYTRSKALVRSIVKLVACSGLECRSCASSEKVCSKFSFVRDSILMNRALDVGWCSPIFGVLNPVTLSMPHFKIVSFYLKLSSDNVVRVEFPEWCLNYVDVIRDVVLAQSIIGRGYPYVLERAHEEAYISSRERRWVLSYIDKLIRSHGGSGIVLSGKFKRKIRGVL